MFQSIKRNGSHWGVGSLLFILFGFTYLVVIRFAISQWPLVAQGFSYDWIFPRTLYPPILIERAPWQDEFNEGRRSYGIDLIPLYLASNATKVGKTYYTCNIPNICAIPGDGRLISPPPQMFFLSEKVYLKFPFFKAQILNSFIQIVLTLLAMVWVFVSCGFKRWIPHATFVILGVYFLTPTGLSLHERGQVDGYPAAGLSLVISGMVLGSLPMTFVGGVIASLKWTSLPFLAVFCSGVILLNWRLNWKTAVSAGFGFWLPFLFFPQHWLAFLDLMREYETLQPLGISFSGWLPFPFSKLILFIPLLPCIWLFFRKVEVPREFLFIYSIPVLILTIPYGNWAWEYRALLTMSWISGFVAWVTVQKKVNSLEVMVTAVVVGLMMALFLRCYPLERVEKLLEMTLSKIYFGLALAWVVAMILLLKSNLRKI